MGVGNNASEAVAIAAGAAFECRARNRIFLHDQPMDAHIYVLLPARKYPADLFESNSKLNYSTMIICTKKLGSIAYSH